jgi:RNase H-like domain found in reverse transcriptase
MVAKILKFFQIHKKICAVLFKSNSAIKIMVQLFVQKINTKLTLPSNQINEAFATLKLEFSKYTLLYKANNKKPLVLVTDASDHATGGLSTQCENITQYADENASEYIKDMSKFQQISCYLHLLTETEKRYSTIGKQLLAVSDTVAANKYI